MLQLIASIVPILPASLLWEIGAEIGAADWDAWGLPVAASGPQAGLGWAGELRDPATGLTYLRARDYSPGTGRFTSRDSLSPNSSGTLAYEPYGYADLNPATMVDPTGHKASPWARCVICTPVLLSVVAASLQKKANLAAAAPAALRSGPIGLGNRRLRVGCLDLRVPHIFSLP